MTATLQTTRLVLTPAAVSDFGDLCALMSDEAFTRFVLPEPIGPEEVWLRLLRDIGHWQALGHGNWTIRLRDSGAFAGVVGILNFRRAIDPPLGPYELGWGVAPAHWKKGLGLEAVRAALAWCDERLQAVRTVCIIDPGNAPSRALAERVGYRSHARALYRNHPLLLLERPRWAATTAHEALPKQADG
ncbi:GNAT family N-acetyltransferase [Brevundimonas diminuta]|uniref:GNAT family N-acetyltransferase n=1 Tax=Brevundimonas diminuta TaxID=293 RepID=A0A1Z3LVI9_BREDI|nr:GNAT family N-acetyltransferase [Brevundimonas diminuta]ASD26224.1 GNAT family N-acetyltransferase [Brevundimonas diminuta]